MIPKIIRGYKIILYEITPEEIKVVGRYGLGNKESAAIMMEQFVADKKNGFCIATEQSLSPITDGE